MFVSQSAFGGPNFLLGFVAGDVPAKNCTYPANNQDEEDWNQVLYFVPIFCYDAHFSRFLF
jgi:hypothetical protein